MTDEVYAIPPDGPGRKRGDRRGGSPALEEHVARDIPEIDQPLTAEAIIQGSSHPIAPVPFDFQGKAVRTITKTGEVWFVAADVCAVLEHSNPTRAVERLDDDEKGLTTIQAHTGNDQMMNIVSESGLYSLVFTSRKPEAKAFRRWVTGVVLPTIRRTGTFNVSGEPRQTPVSDDRVEDANQNGITVTLPGAGRYLVVLFHGGERRIEPISFSDAFSALAALDCRAIAYSHLMAASLWEKMQHLRSIRTDSDRGFTFEKLNATMQAGADLARQILYTYDEPMLVPRLASKTAGE